MSNYRKSSHTLTRLNVHIVRVTKYRYQVLKGDIQQRCRTILIQDREAMEIEILKGLESKDHVHMHIEYPAKLSVSEILKQLKGRSSRILRKELSSLKKRY